MVRRRFRLLFLCLVLAAALLVVLFCSRALWLPALGHALVYDEGPAKADIAVVLAGDAYGHRILKAGELVGAGYVPAALVSGPCCIFGVHESELAIRYAVYRGLPASWFVDFPNESHSTRDEAEAVLAELRRRNIKSFLLVTSDYHTARARRIYRAAERAAGGGPALRVVAAPDEHFRAASWWRNREGRKTACLEWAKTFATFLGM